MRTVRGKVGHTNPLPSQGSKTSCAHAWLPLHLPARPQIVPSQIGFLKNLQVLRLDNNTITALPLEIGQLSCLYTLDLHANFINSLPVQLGGCVKLQVGLGCVGVCIWGPNGGEGRADRGGRGEDASSYRCGRLPVYALGTERMGGDFQEGYLL